LTLSKASLRGNLRGDEVRVSTPVNMASAMA
jgi:hypothetical protein